MQAIGYIRVSTNKQAEKGCSLEAQRERIQAMAVVQQVRLLDIVVDAGESAKDLKRPGIERVLAMVDAGEVNTVIVAKLDRLTRSVRDLADLLELFQRRGASLVSVAEALDTGSASGRLVLNIMVSVSQWEREAISERTKTSLAFKISHNEWIGNTAYGYRLCADRRTVEVDPGEQRIRLSITKLRQEGRSLRQIATHLNKQRRFTRRGTPWRHDGIARVLKTI